LHLELDGITVQAVRRKLTGTEYTKLELKPEMHLQANDILVLSGNSEALEIAEAKLI
jgi:CPA2 family monovalent cation:H+ antiporter-2